MTDLGLAALPPPASVGPTGHGARRALQVGGALLRASLLIGLQYRAGFLLDAVSGVLRTAARIAPIGLVFQHHSAVAGWSMADMTMVMALFLLMQAFLQGFIQPNLGAVVDDVRTGSFDLVLLRPADSQLLVSVRTVDPSQVWDLVAALVVGAAAIYQQPPANALDVLVALGMLVAGMVSLYGLWLFAICLAFLVFRIDNLRYLLHSMTDAARWPVEVYGGWVRWLFTVALPIGVFTSFPAMALRGRWDLELILTAAGVALLFGWGSRRAWLASLERYTSASS
jgi:ABC-2 type transport system permease protein